MNPPYMGSGNMNEVLTNYVRRNYEEGKADLCTVFMLMQANRTIEGGYYANIIPPSWMFLSAFEDLRRNIIENQDRDQNYDYENDEYYGNKPNYANINQEEGQNDYDSSSVDDKYAQAQKYSKSPKQRTANRKKQSSNDSYARANRRQQGRNKDIQMMPRQKKQYNTSYFPNNINNDDDVS